MINQVRKDAIQETQNTNMDIKTHDSCPHEGMQGRPYVTGNLPSERLGARFLSWQCQSTPN